MERIKYFFYDFSVRYKIVLPLIGFASGILINDYIESVWITIAVISPVIGLLSLYLPNFSFLLFLPLGLLFSGGALLTSSGNIAAFSGTKIDLEGTVYRSPETRERGSRLFVNAEYVIEDGEVKPADGKVIIYTSEAVKGLSRGDRIRAVNITLRPITNFKNPGVFDVKRYYGRRGVYATGYVEGEDRIISFGRDKSYSSVIYSLDRVRNRFGHYARESFPYPENGVLNAITIGYNGGIPPELRAEFSRAGVAHVLAISGLHVGAVAVVFFFLFKWLLKRSEYILLCFRVPRLAAALTIFPVFFYTAVAGFSTSAVRAFIMISLFLVSIVAGRDENKLNTLAAAALVILIWHSWSLFELSFQLSFSAVLGILLVNKFYPFRFGTLRDNFLSILKTTCAATFATFPFIVNSFGILPVVSVPANLVVVPFVELLIVPLGIISFLAFLISPFVAAPLLSLNIYFIEMLIFGIEGLNRIPYSSLIIPPPNALSWILFAVLGITLLLTDRGSKLKFLIPLLIVAFVFSAAYPIVHKSGKGALAAYFLDTGENGSVVFLNLPGDKNILIDGGYSNFDRNGYIERAVAGRFLTSSGIGKIDCLILTSTDKGRMEGVKYLLNNFDVRALWTNGDKLDGELWEMIHDDDIEWKNLQSVTEISCPDNIQIEIYKPGGEFVIKDSALPYPVALGLTFEDKIFLFGESLHNSDVQKELTDLYGDKIKSSVLFIPRITTDDTFLRFIRAVSPRVLIADTIEKPGKLGDTGSSELPETVSTFETGTEGAVTVHTNGKELRIKTYVGEKEALLQ